MKRLSNYIGIILVLALLGVLSYLVSTAYLKYSKQLENGTHSAAARLQRDQYSWAVLYPAIRKQTIVGINNQKTFAYSAKANGNLDLHDQYTGLKIKNEAFTLQSAKLHFQKVFGNDKKKMQGVKTVGFKKIIYTDGKQEWSFAIP